jgi:hypothetical protein
MLPLGAFAVRKPPATWDPPLSARTPRAADSVNLQILSIYRVIDGWTPDGQRSKTPIGVLVVTSGRCELRRRRSEKQGSANLPTLEKAPPVSQTDAAKMLNVSVRSIPSATVVRHRRFRPGADIPAQPARQHALASMTALRCVLENGR